MPNELTTTTGQTTDLATRWSEPQLGQSLEAMVSTEAFWTGDEALPVLTGDEAEEAQRALAVYRDVPRGSPPTFIARQLGTLALALPASKLGDGEADGRMKVYQGALADMDSDVLRETFRLAVQRCRFFPTVAELREIAGNLPAPQRVVRAYRLRRLVEQHRRGEPVSVIEAIVDVNALSELRLRLSAPDEATGAQAVAAPVQRATPLPSRLPSIADYLGLGLTQEGAERAVAERMEQEQNRRAA